MKMNLPSLSPTMKYILFSL